MIDPQGGEALDGATVLRDVLVASEPRPADYAAVPDRNKYAVRFADRMAIVIARDLNPKLKGIVASPERGAASARGKKQLDINFSTPQLGLALGISLKSVHLRAFFISIALIRFLQLRYPYICFSPS